MTVAFGFAFSRNASLEPADGFVVGDEKIRALRGRTVHAVGGTDDQAARVAELGLVHRRVPADGGQAFVLLCQRHTAVLRPQRHRRVIRLSGECRQRDAVARVVEAAQTFERI